MSFRRPPSKRRSSAYVEFAEVGAEVVSESNFAVPGKSSPLEDAPPTPDAASKTGYTSSGESNGGNAGEEPKRVGSPDGPRRRATVHIDDGGIVPESTSPSASLQQIRRPSLGRRRSLSMSGVNNLRPGSQFHTVELTKEYIQSIAEAHGVSPEHVRDVALAAQGDTDLMLAILQSEVEERLASPNSVDALHYGTHDVVQRLLEFLELPPSWKGEVIRTLNATNGDAQEAAGLLAQKAGQRSTQLPNTIVASQQQALTDMEAQELPLLLLRLGQSPGGATQALQAEFPERPEEEIRTALRLTDGNVEHARTFLRQDRAANRNLTRDEMDNVFARVAATGGARPRPDHKKQIEAAYHKLNGAIGARASLADLTSTSPGLGDDTVTTSLSPQEFRQLRDNAVAAPNRERQASRSNLLAASPAVSPARDASSSSTSGAISVAPRTSYPFHRADGASQDAAAADGGVTKSSTSPAVRRARRPSLSKDAADVPTRLATRVELSPTAHARGSGPSSSSNNASSSNLPGSEAGSSPNVPPDGTSNTNSRPCPHAPATVVAPRRGSVAAVNQNQRSSNATNGDTRSSAVPLDSRGVSGKAAPSTGAAGHLTSSYTPGLSEAGAAGQQGERPQNSPHTESLLNDVLRRASQPHGDVGRQRRASASNSLESDATGSGEAVAPTAPKGMPPPPPPVSSSGGASAPSARLPPTPPPPPPASSGFSSHGPAPPAGLPPPPPPPPSSPSTSGAPAPSPPVGLPPPPPPPAKGAPPPPGIPPSRPCPSAAGGGAGPPPPPPSIGGAPPPPPPPPPGLGRTGGPAAPPPPPPPPGTKGRPGAAAPAANTGKTRPVPINGAIGDSVGVFGEVTGRPMLSDDARKQLEELFTKRELKPKGEMEEATSRAMEILTPDRDRNVGIVLKFIRLPIQQIEASIRTFDTLTLGEERVSGLLKIIPSAEDLEAINRARKAHGKPWSRTEQQELPMAVRFILMTQTIDHYAERIHAWSLKYKLHGDLEDLEQKLAKANRAIDAIFDSRSLPDMLYFLLEVSNFLNKGSRFQDAKGFPITQLPQIMDFKTTDGKSTLLSYVAESLSSMEASNPSQAGMLHISDELMPMVEAGREIDVPSIEQELKKLRGRLQKCKLLIEELKNDSRWTTVLGKFIIRALPELERVEKLAETIDGKMERLCTFLCEKKETFSLNEVLRTLTMFCKRFDQEQEKMQLRKERLARAEDNRRRQSDVAAEANAQLAQEGDVISPSSSTTVPRQRRMSQQQQQQPPPPQRSPQPEQRRLSGAKATPVPPGTNNNKDSRTPVSNNNGATTTTNGHTNPHSPGAPSSGNGNTRSQLFR